MRESKIDFSAYKGIAMREALEAQQLVGGRRGVDGEAGMMSEVPPTR
jgi:hypothetical protein